MSEEQKQEQMFGEAPPRPRLSDHEAFCVLLRSAVFS
jgi:hypothetical protein